MNLQQSSEHLRREAKTDELLNSSLDDVKRQSMLSEHKLEDIIMSADDSWNDYKKKYEESKEVIDPNVTPIGQSIITTATLLNIMEQKKYLMSAEFDVNMIENLKKSISEVQTVVAVGPSCREVKVGDIVKIRTADFVRIQNPNSVHSQEIFELPLELINGRDYIEMHERNLKYIINK